MLLNNYNIAFNNCSKISRELCLQTIKLARTKKDKKQKEKLYQIISVFAFQAKDGSKNAQTVLFHVYYPLIAVATRQIYNNLAKCYYPRITISDLFQDSCELFFLLIQDYNSDRASFTHYVNIMLYKRLHQRTTKEIVRLQREKLFAPTADSQIVDMSFREKDPLLGAIIQKDLLQEIHTGIQKRINGGRRTSKTPELVYKEIIFGLETCSSLSKKLGISYHAVHEILDKQKQIIADIVNHNDSCGYSITISSSKHKRFDINRIKETTDIPFFIRNHTKCPKCAQPNRIRKEHILDNLLICKDCGHTWKAYSETYNTRRLYKK
jgi:hypothetical protein